MVNAWLAAGSINGVEICKNRCYERRMTTQQPFLKDTTPAVQSALKTFAIERAGIMAIEAAFGDEALSELARCFSEVVARFAALKGRVVVTGMGKSGHVGRKLAATFASTGTPAFFVHPAEASHGDMGMIQEGDAILALSWSGETAELADIITFSRRFNILLVAFTSNMAGTLAREADIALILPKSEEACPNGLHQQHRPRCSLCWETRSPSLCSRHAALRRMTLRCFIRAGSLARGCCTCAM